MHIIIVEPGKKPREADIENNKETLEKIIGGCIAEEYPFEDDAILLCGIECTLKEGTEWNRWISETFDAIKGTFIVCEKNGNEYTDLSSELTEKYMKRFQNVEVSIPDEFKTIICLD